MQCSRASAAARRSFCSSSKQRRKASRKWAWSSNMPLSSSCSELARAPTNNEFLRALARNSRSSARRASHFQRSVWTAFTSEPDWSWASRSSVAHAAAAPTAAWRRSTTTSHSTSDRRSPGHSPPPESTSPPSRRQATSSAAAAVRSTERPRACRVSRKRSRSSPRRRRSVNRSSKRQASRRHRQREKRRRWETVAPRDSSSRRLLHSRNQAISTWWA
mmetsp:Transcript_73165/g.185327  ORF Transcript_73165/g.185327 Transcript_73165/m.185327 type:complete len:218 (-) Transcript_73165:728-1381(-)